MSISPPPHGTSQTASLSRIDFTAREPKEEAGPKVDTTKVTIDFLKREKNE